MPLTSINFTPYLSFTFLMQPLKTSCAETVQTSQQSRLYQLFLAETTLPFFNLLAFFRVSVSWSPRSYGEVWICLTGWPISWYPQRTVSRAYRGLFYWLSFVFLPGETTENVKNSVNFHFFKVMFVFFNALSSMFCIFFNFGFLMQREYTGCFLYIFYFTNL